jgi:hypothetical protein
MAKNKGVVGQDATELNEFADYYTELMSEVDTYLGENSLTKPFENLDKRLEAVGTQYGESTK